MILTQATWKLLYQIKNKLLSIGTIHRAFNEFRTYRSQIMKDEKINQVYQKHLASLQRSPELVIIGARGGFGTWDMWAAKRMVNVTGFEPDGQECEALQASRAYAKFLPYGLGDYTGDATLHITALPDCSSCLNPNFDLLKRYPVHQWFEIKKTTRMSIYRFDDLYRGGNVALPDFLQIDVQGLEYEVLEGLGDCLNNVLCIEAETHLLPIYENQKLFTELKLYLENKGFQLRHLQPHGPFEGEVVELNVYFTRRSDGLTNAQLAMVHFWEEVCNIPLPYNFSKHFSLMSTPNE